MNQDVLFTDVLWNFIRHKQLEMHGCVLTTVATDALVLKHQGISTHNAE